jgi:hypothetical protein
VKEIVFSADSSTVEITISPSQYKEVNVSELKAITLKVNVLLIPIFCKSDFSIVKLVPDDICFNNVFPTYTVISKVNLASEALT